MAIPKVWNLRTPIVSLTNNPLEWVFIEEDPSSPTFDESGIANIAGVQEGPAAVAITKPKISRDGSREITRAVLRFFHELPPQQRISIVIRDVESGIRDWLSEEVRNHYYQTLTDHNQTSRKLHGFLTDRVKDLKKWVCEPRGCRVYTVSNHTYRASSTPTIH